MPQVQDHYAREGIAARVLAALRAERGEDVAITPDALAPLDHLHGRGVLATEDLATMLAIKPGQRVLDIGSGIARAGAMDRGALPMPRHRHRPDGGVLRRRRGAERRLRRGRSGTDRARQRARPAIPGRQL